MNLHDVINSGSFGSGKRARDLLNAKEERRRLVPPRERTSAMIVEHEPDALVASFGYDVEDGKDYHINSYGGALIENEPLAGRDARAIAALWNAYRDGDLVWKDEQPKGSK